MQTTRFVHHRLDAFHVARAALVAGDAVVRKLPRGYGTLADQIRRGLLGAYLRKDAIAVIHLSDAGTLDLLLLRARA